MLESAAGEEGLRTGFNLRKHAGPHSADAGLCPVRSRADPGLMRTMIKYWKSHMMRYFMVPRVSPGGVKTVTRLGGAALLCY